MTTPPHVVVIGGGAAGFFGAITAAESFPKARVTLLEGSRQVLSKVRISGGGRCNVTQACFDPAILVQSYPRGSQALRGPFARFQPRDTIRWFEARGVQLKTEADGRVFPITNSSATIVNCLIRSAEQAGVAIWTGIKLALIERSTDHSFVLQPKGDQPIECDRLLLATGSNRQGYRWAEALGHTIESPVPSLFTFTINDLRLTDLAGISVGNVRLQLVGTHLKQAGPLLITHRGLSGPATLKLSAWGARYLYEQGYLAALAIDWLPEIQLDDLKRRLASVKSEQALRSIAGHSVFKLPQRLWQKLVAAADITADQRWADLSKVQLNQLIEQLTHGVFHIRGRGAFQEEFVTCGGVRLDEVNFRTMASRRCPHLYFAGEILDIDGLTGGFNFQSAWTTGWIAGQAIGRRDH
jgi:predicted Rossmann fold flavoprotein